MKKMLIGLLVLLMLMPCAQAAKAFVPSLPGNEAPDFEAPMLDGEIFRLSDHRGKVILLNIWATWCPACVAGMPNLEQLSQDYSEELVVIGVNCGEDAQTVREFVKEKGYTYCFVTDEEYLISGMLYPTSTLPCTVVIDADGVITRVNRGSSKDMYEVFEGYVLEAIENTKITEVEILA